MLTPTVSVKQQLGKKTLIEKGIFPSFFFYFVFKLVPMKSNLCYILDLLRFLKSDLLLNVFFIKVTKSYFWFSKSFIIPFSKEKLKDILEKYLLYFYLFQLEENGHTSTKGTTPVVYKW